MIKLISLIGIGLSQVMSPTTLSANTDCSYCQSYLNRLECVEHCLSVRDQSRSASPAPRFNVTEAKQEEAKLGLSLDQRKAVQAELNKLLPWEKPLATDGVFGPATRKMIRSWEFINMPGVKQGYRDATGYLDASKHTLILQTAETQKRKAQVAFDRSKADSPWERSRKAKNDAWIKSQERN